MACVTGFAVAVAASGWWNMPITHVLWLGIVWAVVIFIHRLIYKSFGTNRLANLALRRSARGPVRDARAGSWPTHGAVHLPPSINNALTHSIAVQQKKRRRRRGLLRAEDQGGAGADRRVQNHEVALRNQVSKFTRLTGCEAAKLRARTRTLPVRAVVSLLRAAGRNRPVNASSRRPDTEEDRWASGRRSWGGRPQSRKKANAASMRSPGTGPACARRGPDSSREAASGGREVCALRSRSVRLSRPSGPRDEAHALACKRRSLRGGRVRASRARSPRGASTARADVCSRARGSAEEARADVDAEEVRIELERTRRIADEQTTFIPKPKPALS